MNDTENPGSEDATPDAEGVPSGTEAAQPAEAPTASLYEPAMTSSAVPGAFAQEQQPIRVAVPPQSPPRRRSWVPVVGALAAGAVFGAAAGAGSALLVLRSAPTDAAGAPPAPQTITVNDPESVNTIAAVAANAMDSVVTISVSSDAGAGTGSGVVLDSDGRIVTNTHVVTLGGATADAKIRVTTSSGHVYDAKLLGTDPLMDLAVIQVENAPELVPIEFADSDALNVGDVTIAIGAPLGFSGTVTSGIVSALDRSIQVASSAAPEGDAPAPDDSGNPFDYFRFDLPGVESSTPQSAIQIPVVQTDTAINPGNSGGALLDANGRLIGINVAIAGGTGGSVGVGFAIPSNTVKRITSELIENGTATHGLLGVSVADVANDTAQTDTGIIGASVVKVVDGGGASDAGIQVGDIIIEFDGIPIRSRNDLTAQVRTHAIGDTVPLVYVRGGASHTVDVTLGDLNDSQP